MMSRGHDSAIPCACTATIRREDVARTRSFVYNKCDNVPASAVESPRVGANLTGRTPVLPDPIAFSLSLHYDVFRSLSPYLFQSLRFLYLTSRPHSPSLPDK